MSNTKKKGARWPNLDVVSYKEGDISLSTICTDPRGNDAGVSVEIRSMLNIDALLADIATFRKLANNVHTPSAMGREFTSEH